VWDKAHVINLDERVDRWEWMQGQLASAGIEAERFPAISIRDLAELPPPPSLRQFLLEVDGDGPGFERKLWATWACMQSHLAILRLAREQGLASVLILEDDCEFEPFSRAVLSRLKRQLPDLGLDFLYLGGTLKKGGSCSRLSSNVHAVSRVRLAHAYVVSASVYERILDEAPESGLPIDWYYSEVLLSSVRAGISSPQLAFQRLDDVSSIEGVVRPRKFRWRRFWIRAFSRLRYCFG